MIKKIAGLMLVLVLCNKNAAANDPLSTGWKASAASVIITPAEFIRMAGFAFRNRAADGKYSDLRAKAVALEDASGKRVLLFSLDLCAVSKLLSDNVRNRLKQLFNLSREQIVLNCTHTHSGPEISTDYLQDPEEKRKVVKYEKQLEEQLVTLAGKVLRSLQPVVISSENGVTRLEVNRRNNTESELLYYRQFNGPNDFAVPVLRITDNRSRLIAVIFGYACHNSILREYKWSADYAGYAEEMLEQDNPGSTALFFQGTGGNQIAYPRGSVESARQHGHELAAAVERVMAEKMDTLTPKLVTSYAEIPLAVDMGKNAAKTYPYPLQVWKIGQQPLITMGGEPLVEYALQFKRMFGQHIFVFGYSNDVMAYMSTAAVLNEGGYEGASSPYTNGHWALTIESSIIKQVTEMAKRVQVPLFADYKPYH